MCHRLGVDVWEVIDAAATKPFGFMKFVPGPGLGGHCIPIDPFYLSWKLRTLNYRARFIELAGEVNSEMPDYVLDLITGSLNDAQKSVRGSRVLVLGGGLQGQRLRHARVPRPRHHGHARTARRGRRLPRPARAGVHRRRQQLQRASS